MNDASDRPSCSGDLAFFGKMGVDLSHEMRNILSATGEYAGLLEDLLALAEGGRPLDHARLAKLSAGMHRQVKKGTETMARFSRFAHAADDLPIPFDLAALTANTAALAGRHAALARCTLRTELPAEEMPMALNPFGLQHAIFSAIQAVLDSQEAGGVVTVQLEDSGKAAILCISGSAPLCEATSQTSALSSLASSLKGSLSVSSEEGKGSLTLTFPRA